MMETSVWALRPFFWPWLAEFPVLTNIVLGTRCAVLTALVTSRNRNRQQVCQDHRSWHSWWTWMEISHLFVKGNCILSLNQLAKARRTKRETYDTLIYHGFWDQGTATRGQQPALVVHTLVANQVSSRYQPKGGVSLSTKGRAKSCRRNCFFFSIPLLPLGPGSSPPVAMASSVPELMAEARAEQALIAAQLRALKGEASPEAAPFSPYTPSARSVASPTALGAAGRPLDLEASPMSSPKMAASPEELSALRAHVAELDHELVQRDCAIEELQAKLRETQEALEKLGSASSFFLLILVRFFNLGSQRKTCGACMVTNMSTPQHFPRVSKIDVATGACPNEESAAVTGRGRTLEGSLPDCPEGKWTSWPRGATCNSHPSWYPV